MPEEKSFFDNNFKLEQTGRVSTTANFALLFQIPAYFSGSTIDSLSEVIEVMGHGSLDRLKKHSPEKGAMIDAYMPEMFQRIFYGESLNSKSSEIIDRYGLKLIEVYDRYYREYWKTAAPKMKKRMELIRRGYFDDFNVISEWEEETGLDFPYPNFVVELADPIKVLGTSLMAERGAFSYWAPPERIFTVVSHEVGTHTFIQRKTLASPGLEKIFEKDPEKTIRFIEALSYLLNLKIIGKQNHSIYYRIQFGELFKKEIKAMRENLCLLEKGDISINDLIAKSLEMDDISSNICIS